MTSIDPTQWAVSGDNVDITSKCAYVHWNFTWLDWSHALMVWEGFKTKGIHCHHHHYHHDCHFYPHHHHIYHDPIFPSMPTKIKPYIPNFPVKPIEDANFHVFSFSVWNYLRRLNHDSIKLAHPQINYKVKHATCLMVNNLVIILG